MILYGWTIFEIRCILVFQTLLGWIESNYWNNQNPHHIFNDTYWVNISQNKNVLSKRGLIRWVSSHIEQFCTVRGLSDSSFFLQFFIIRWVHSASHALVHFRRRVWIIWFSVKVFKLSRNLSGAFFRDPQRMVKIWSSGAKLNSGQTPSRVDKGPTGLVTWGQQVENLHFEQQNM